MHHLPLLVTALRLHAADAGIAKAGLKSLTPLVMQVPLGFWSDLSDCTTISPSITVPSIPVTLLCQAPTDHFAELRDAVLACLRMHGATVDIARVAAMCLWGSSIQPGNRVRPRLHWIFFRQPIFVLL